MRIGDREIGNGKKCFIIAEIAQAHDGSLGAAHAYIDAVADAGSDAIKFQTHIAEAESTIDEPFRVNFSFEDKTRYDYWKRMEFTKEQWKKLAEHAHQRDLIFLSSPFSKQAVDLLDELDIHAWKIGSGEAFNPLIINQLKSTMKPILISTGMSSKDDVISIKNKFENYLPGYAVFQCTTMYPTPLDKVGLNNLKLYKDLGIAIVGLSDHSGTVFPALTAISRGVDIIEVHVNFDKRMFGPDSSSSLTFDELGLIIKHADSVHHMDCSPVNKDKLSDELSDIKNIFNKGLIMTSNKSKGEVILFDDLDAKKPCVGIPSDQFQNVVGKKLLKNINAGERLDWDVLDVK
jgi:N,N'-diacetyllegionaminate synthase